MRWLIPRLAEFRKISPQTEIRVSTAFSNDPVLKGSIDLSIRRSPGDLSQFKVSRLFEERATVITSPRLIANRRRWKPGDLASQILLSTESRPGDWESWLDVAGIRELRPAQRLRFDHFFVTLQAVVDGMGFGIGTFPTLSRDKAENRIATPFPHLTVKGSTYFSLVPLDTDKPKYFLDFHDWLLGACNAEN